MTSVGKNKARNKQLSRNQVKPDQASISLARAGGGLFLLSAASLAFEITLTHLFSFVMQYHFAFLAISTAILGLGIGAAISYLVIRKEQEASPERIGTLLSQMAAISAIAMPVVAILFNLIGFVPGVVLQAVVGALPFLAVGLATARLYAAFSSRATWLYALDLLGAAAGLLIVQTLLNLVSPASVVFVAGLAAACSAWAFSGVNHASRLPEKKERTALISLGLILVGLVLNLVTHFADLPITAYSDAPADKTMFQVLADRSQGARLIDSAWSSFARVDLVTTSNPDQMYAFTNGGAGSYMIRFEGDLSKVSWLKDQLEYIPFDNFNSEQTLILGAGAGKDILQALLAGSKSITAVEINPAMASITRKYASFNGNILDYSGVTTVVADGRAYIESTAASFDMIYLNLVYAQAPAPGSNALSESYIFTTQAFREYWHHLTPNGRLAVISHQGLEGSRALLTAVKALNLEGFSTIDALKHTALLMYNGNDPNQNTTVMILQKSQLTVDQATFLGQASQNMGMMPLFLPGAFEDLLQALVSGHQTLDQYVKGQDYNLFPTQDDQPFFFAITQGLPQPLIILMIVAGIGTLIFLLWILFGFKKSIANGKTINDTKVATSGRAHPLIDQNQGNGNRPSVWHLVYFGGLGLGFMLVEVPLIQRMLLIAGSPTAAMVTVLEVLLLGGGLGSLLSGRLKTHGLWVRLAWAAGLASILAAALAIWQPGFIASLSSKSEFERNLLADMILLPSGFVMGVPFANGLRLVGERNPAVLPALWGWNAVISVMGSSLAACLAMLSGFWAAMLIGAGCYALVTAAALVLGANQKRSEVSG